jgi:WD40 repeat protein
LASDAGFCPYVGLQPFTEEDRAYFFGREREIRLVGANLYAAKLTVLYGESGVGKSSLLMAGVVPELRNKPRTAVVIFREWQRPEAVSILKVAVARGADEAAGKPLGLNVGAPLDELLAAAGKGVGGTTLVLLDQFEEYFLYNPPGGAGDEFDAELARAVNRRDVNAGFVLSIREDSLSKLDRFRARIPTVLANPLRIRHLRAPDARDAIRKPLDVYNRRPETAGNPVTIEPALVDALIEQTISGRVSLAQTGAAVDSQTESGERVEAPYLQLVLTRLWEEEARVPSRVLRVDTLRTLGGASQIVQTHLDQVMSRLSSNDQALCAEFFDRLVTPSGTKIACRLDDLKKWAGAGHLQHVERVVAALAAPEARILRAIDPLPGQPPQYEIFHDVLAAGVLAWRSHYVEARKHEEAKAEAERQRKEAERESERQRAQKRWAVLVAGLSVAIAVVAGLSWYFASEERKRANEARREAEGRDLASQSLLIGEADATKALHLAVAAVEKSRGEQAALALRLAVSAMKLRGKVDLPQGERVVAADASGDGTSAALALSNGTVEIRAIPSLKVIREYRIREQEAPAEIRYSGDRGSLFLRWPNGKVWKLSTETGEHDIVPAATESVLALDPYGNGIFSFKADTAVFMDEESLRVKELRRCSKGQPIASIASGDRALLAERIARTNTVQVCDAISGKVIREIGLGDRPHDDFNDSGFLFSQDGGLIAGRKTSAEEVHVWDVQTGKNVTLRDFTATPSGLRFGRDRTLIIDLFDGVIEVWKLSGLDTKEGGVGPPRNELVARLQSAHRALVADTAGLAGQFVLSAHDDGLRLWTIGPETPKGVAVAHPIAHAALDLGGQPIVALRDGTIARLEEGGNLAVLEPPREGNEILKVEGSADRRQVLIAWRDGLISVWDLTAARRLAEIHVAAPLTFASWASRCCAFVARRSDGTAQIIELKDGGSTESALETESRDEGWLSPSRRYWVTKEGVAVGPLGTGAQSARRELPGKPTNRSWPFLPDDRIVVLDAFRPPRIDALDARARALDLIGHSLGARDAEVSPDGKFLATASDDWHAILWDADTGERRARLVGHMRSVQEVMFSSNGTFLATLGEDDTLRVWEPLSGTQLVRVQVARGVKRLLNFEMSTVMLAVPDNRFVRIECEPCRPIDQLKDIARDRLDRLGATGNTEREVSPARAKRLQNPAPR